MDKKKIIKKLIVVGVCIIILLLGIFSQRISFALGMIIGLLFGLVNSRLIIRTTLRGLEFETRKKVRWYYFRTNLLKYSIVILFIYLIIITKKISIYGLLFGLLLSVLFILTGIY